MCVPALRTADISCAQAVAMIRAFGGSRSSTCSVDQPSLRLTGPLRLLKYSSDVPAPRADRTLFPGSMAVTLEQKGQDLRCAVLERFGRVSFLTLTIVADLLYHKVSDVGCAVQ